MIAWITNTPLILILASAAGVIIGLCVFSSPGRAIEIQRKFYERINWRIEPISMRKEIRNTKIMGMFLVAVSVAAMIFYGLKLI